VIDAGPLVSLLLDEATAPRVSARLEELLPICDLSISSVNWCEVLYTARTKAGPFVEALAVRGFRAFPISVIDADERLASYAADVKARFGLGLGDSFAAGLALALDAPLLTGDADFLPLAEHGLRIDWVGEERP
jgi:predicted nucleic acid-binding protein